ncbi:hypothetical protein J2S89_000060 [Arthrobacter bambusae]|nr:hypothetical protein [Arthrobacter bambusae]MDQ0096954.1 hypothetical protein [Arthrobacter bambusae]
MIRLRGIGNLHGFATHDNSTPRRDIDGEDTRAADMAALMNPSRNGLHSSLVEAGCVQHNARWISAVRRGRKGGLTKYIRSRCHLDIVERKAEFDGGTRRDRSGVRYLAGASIRP